MCGYCLFTVHDTVKQWHMTAPCSTRYPSLLHELHTRYPLELMNNRAVGDVDHKASRSIHFSMHVEEWDWWHGFCRQVQDEIFLAELQQFPDFCLGIWWGCLCPFRCSWDMSLWRNTHTVEWPSSCEHDSIHSINQSICADLASRTSSENGDNSHARNAMPWHVIPRRNINLVGCWVLILIKNRIDHSDTLRWLVKLQVLIICLKLITNNCCNIPLQNPLKLL